MTFINHGQFEKAASSAAAAVEGNALPSRLPRANTSLGAELHWSGISRRCQVRDLSEGGALLVVDAPPAKDTRVLLVRGQHRLGASIVWSDARRCGLRFDHAVVVADLISGKGAPSIAAPAAAATHSIPAEVLTELCARADRLAAAIGQVAGIGPSVQADCLALAHALHRLRLAPDAA